LLIACIGWLAAAWALPEKDWPDWARGARTRPFLASGAETLKSLVPGSARDRSAALAAEAQGRLEQAKDAERLMRTFSNPGGSPGAAPPAAEAPKGAPSPSAYKAQERKEMDRL